MSRRLGFGIIGAGVIFDSHANALRALGDRARLVAVADLDEGKLNEAGRKHFFPFAHRDYRELLSRKDIDVITVATPPSTHEELVLASLAAGKHVICEKPLAHTLASADRIIQAAVEHDRRVSVSHQLRFLPEVTKMSWLKETGQLGELRYGNFKRLSQFAGHAGDGDSWWGRWSVAGGGVVMTQLIHELDLMLNLFGTPIQVSAAMDTLQQRIESEDTFAATVRFANGAIVTCSSTINAHGYGASFDVVGSDASVHYPWDLKVGDAAQRRTILRKLAEQPKPDRTHSGRWSGLTQKALRRLGSAGLPGRMAVKAMRKLGIEISTGSTHTAYLVAVLDALENDAEVPVTPAEARGALEMCLAMYTSAMLDRPVSLPLDQTGYYDGISTDVYNDRTCIGVRAA